MPVSKKAKKTGNKSKKEETVSKKSFAKDLRKKLKETMSASPLLEGLLDELERVENIRNTLYDAYNKDKLFEEYTNKAGYTNLIINAAIKEYKAYSQRFNDLVKTIHVIIKDIIIVGGTLPNGKPAELDEFEKLVKRGK